MNKIIYQWDDANNEEALRILYGEQIKIFERSNNDISQYSRKKYIVMPIFPGVTILEFIDLYVPNVLDPKFRALEMPLAHQIGIMLASTTALLRIHEQSWVHNDVKYNNMLITTTAAGFHVSIIDADDMLKEGQSIPRNAPIGTEYYFSPELINRAFFFQASYATDVYALGISFIELLIPGIEEEENFSKHVSWQHFSRKEKFNAYLYAWQKKYLQLSECVNAPDLFRSVINKLIGLLDCMLRENGLLRPKTKEILQVLTSMANMLRQFQPGQTMERYNIPALIVKDDINIDTQAARHIRSSVPLALSRHDSESDSEFDADTDADMENGDHRHLLPTQVAQPHQTQTKPRKGQCCVIS